MPAAKTRITGGQARGLPIVEPKGVRLRPTSGLVREAIFNLVGASVEDARALDLFAGTGALGLEALSRGASAAVFVEGEAAACQAILQTLSRTDFHAKATVLRGKLPAALQHVPGEFDLIFMDPPYQSETGMECLLLLGALLRAGGLVVYEHGSRYNPAERPGGLRRIDRRVYGDSAVALYVQQEGQ